MYTIHLPGILDETFNYLKTQEHPTLYFEIYYWSKVIKSCDLGWYSIFSEICIQILVGFETWK